MLSTILFGHSSFGICHVMISSIFFKHASSVVQILCCQPSSSDYSAIYHLRLVLLVSPSLPYLPSPAISKDLTHVVGWTHWNLPGSDCCWDVIELEGRTIIVITLPFGWGWVGLQSNNMGVIYQMQFYHNY